jgi:uncharacterized spore protein YtfJ
MSTLAVLQSLKESVLSQASVKAIYGEPISAHGKTVVPVAKIMYGYGAGAGTGGVGDASARGEGGGGGGGVRAIPVGVIEISEHQTSFVPITDRKKLTGAVLAGIGLGVLLGWRTRRWKRIRDYTYHRALITFAQEWGWENPLLLGHSSIKTTDPVVTVNDNAIYNLHRWRYRVRWTASWGRAVPGERPWLGRSWALFFLHRSRELIVAAVKIRNPLSGWLAYLERELSNHAFDLRDMLPQRNPQLGHNCLQLGGVRGCHSLSA